jgi:hypothetical protein
MTNVYKFPVDPTLVWPNLLIADAATQSSRRNTLRPQKVLKTTQILNGYLRSPQKNIVKQMQMESKLEQKDISRKIALLNSFFPSSIVDEVKSHFLNFSALADGK